jgi:hypothetical protein
MILRVKTHKTCKIEVKTRKPVKSVKPGQTRIKMGQLEKNIKNVTFSRVNQNFQQMQKFWNALWLSSLFSVPIPTPPHPWHSQDFVPVSLFFHPLEMLSLPIERPHIDSALSKFISSVLPHFIDFDFCDFLPDRFHQVYFQNIVFILVFFLCLISVDYDALSLIYLITFKFVDFFYRNWSLYILHHFFLFCFCFSPLIFFFCFYFSISI